MPRDNSTNGRAESRRRIFSAIRPTPPFTPLSATSPLSKSYPPNCSHSRMNRASLKDSFALINLNLQRRIVRRDRENGRYRGGKTEKDGEDKRERKRDERSEGREVRSVSHKAPHPPLCRRKQPLYGVSSETASRKIEGKGER